MISKILDTLLSIVIIVGVIILIVQLISEIIITAKIERPQDCVRINADYYCKVHKNINNKGIVM